MFEDYLIREHFARLTDILSSNDTTTHHSINIPYKELFDEEQALGELLLNSPDEGLNLIQSKLIIVLNKIQKGEDSSDFESVPVGNIHVRIYDLNLCPKQNLYKFPTVRPKKYVQLSGTVTRLCAVKMLRSKRDFICQKCKEIMTISASYEQNYRIIAPKHCPSEKCNGKQMIEVKEVQPSYCKDFQEIKLQEDLTLIGSSVMPRSMWITLEDDLVDICKPGDSIIVCGIIKRRWSPLSIGKHFEESHALQACHVTINNIPDGLARQPTHNFDDFWQEHRDGNYSELQARDAIIRSFAPEIHGLYLVKLAVAVILAGGGSGDGGSDAGRTRSEPHLLLVGDPGTGKSQLLRQAVQIIPRSVRTTGIGSTSAGLTVSAIMEGGEWQLEAGALVLSDGGICCIDEFNTMREHDRASIHEAMEQQSISVAKASIVCKLNTRCSVLAAANPQAPFESNKPLSSNLALASPLLSRFDLILALKDRVDEKRDSRVADFILSHFVPFPKNPVSPNKCHANHSEDPDVWTLDMLKEYYMKVRKLKPELSSSVLRILNTYYQHRRRTKFRNEARTTVRLLESLVRLSKAHAKLMYRETVTVLDAVMAIVLLEAGEVTEENDSCALFDAQAEFPDEVDEWYKRAEKIIGGILQIDLAEEGKLEYKAHHIKSQEYKPANFYEKEIAKDNYMNIHECSTRIEIEEDGQSKCLKISDIEENQSESRTENSNQPICSTELWKVDKDRFVIEEDGQIEGLDKSDIEENRSLEASAGNLNDQECSKELQRVEEGQETGGTEPTSNCAMFFPAIFGTFDADDFDIDV